MIVTCASCLTKFNLEESRIPARGAKVRCSRCRHVFYVVSSPESRQVAADLDAGFSGSPDPVAAPIREESRPADTSLPPFSSAGADETDFPLPPEPAAPPQPVRREKVEVQTSRPKRSLQVDKPTRSAPAIALIILLILLVIAFFCFWTGYGETLYSYLEYPARKIADVWNQLWGP
jgi:predicted Zn finger-like uncharacterized protein